MERISSFIIGLILVGMVVGGLGIFFAGVSTGYGVSYDAAGLAAFNQTSALQSSAASINQTISHFNPANPLDVIGGFLTGGYQVLTVSWQSFAAFMSIGEAANAQLASTPAGGSLSFFTSGLFLMVFVGFIFIVVAVLVGRDRL